MTGETYFWLGASADAETGSTSLRSPEPLCVSAHAGDDPARVVATLYTYPNGEYRIELHRPGAEL